MTETQGAAQEPIKAAIGVIIKMNAKSLSGKQLSQNRNRKSKVIQPDIETRLLFPANEQASIAILPTVRALYSPSSSLFPFLNVLSLLTSGSNMGRHFFVADKDFRIRGNITGIQTKIDGTGRVGSFYFEACQH